MLEGWIAVPHCGIWGNVPRKLNDKIIDYQIDFN